MAVVIMVDDCANISKEMKKKYDIITVPFYVTFSNGDSYKNNVEIKNRIKLKELIDTHREIPSIKRANKEELEKTFKKYIDRGFDVIYICVSSYLSSSYQEVVSLASRFNPSNIAIVDSLNVGSGQALLALYAKKYADMGYGLKQTLKYIEEIKPLIKSSYAIGNAKMLYAQNRCKELDDNYIEFYNRIPVVDINKGKIVVTYNAIESELASQMLKDMIMDYKDNMNDTYAIISYLNNKSDALSLKKQLIKWKPNIQVEIVENNSVIISHCGNNSLSIAFLLK